MNFKQAAQRVVTDIPILEVWNTEIGGNYPVGNQVSVSCPFHGDGQDRTKSAKAYPDSNKVWCWGCSKSRDAIDIIRERQGLGFRAAVEYLVGKYLHESIEYETGKEFKVVEESSQSRAARKMDFVEQIAEKHKDKLGWRKYAEACYILDFLRFSIRSKKIEEETLFTNIEKLEVKLCQSCLVKASNAKA